MFYFGFPHSSLSSFLPSSLPVSFPSFVHVYLLGMRIISLQDGSSFPCEVWLRLLTGSLLSNCQVPIHSLAFISSKTTSKSHYQEFNQPSPVSKNTCPLAMEHYNRGWFGVLSEIPSKALFLLLCVSVCVREPSISWKGQLYLILVGRMDTKVTNTFSETFSQRLLWAVSLLLPLYGGSQTACSCLIATFWTGVWKGIQ